MHAEAYTLFGTTIGRCAVAWNENGVAGVQLLEADDSKTRRLMLARFSRLREAPPPNVQRAIHGITSLLQGRPTDLTAVALDMNGVPQFNRRVYEIARCIPPGQTMSYGEIAQQLGDHSLAQDVGKALGRNPFPIIVPCHRVLAAGGKVGGFSGPGGIQTKLRLLAIEGAESKSSLPLFDRLAATHSLKS